MNLPRHETLSFSGEETEIETEITHWPSPQSGRAGRPSSRSITQLSAAAPPISLSLCAFSPYPRALLPFLVLFSALLHDSNPSSRLLSRLTLSLHTQTLTLYRHNRLTCAGLSKSSGAAASASSRLRFLSFCMFSTC